MRRLTKKEILQTPLTLPELYQLTKKRWRICPSLPVRPEHAMDVVGLRRRSPMLNFSTFRTTFGLRKSRRPPSPGVVLMMRKLSPVGFTQFARSSAVWWQCWTHIGLCIVPQRPTLSRCRHGPLSYGRCFIGCSIRLTAREGKRTLTRASIALSQNSPGIL